MKNLLMMTFLILFRNGYSQDCPGNIEVNTDLYKGISFEKNCPKGREDDKALRWTPTLRDIAKAECLLNEYFENNSSKKLVNQGYDNCPIIKNNITRYFRQYVGEINKNGNRIIYIRAIWDSEAEKLSNRYSEIFPIEGMCSKIWTIKINIDKKKISEFYVNGN